MAQDPVILSSFQEYGRHNADLDKTVSRLDQEASWKDLSTVMITPSGPPIAPCVVHAWESMIVPPNNRFCRLMAIGMEVGEAYSRCIEGILNHPELSTWKYVCFREHDNLMPPDGLIKLLRQMEAHPEYAGVSGLYWTKGHSGQPQCWGDPNEHPFNFRPQKPRTDGGLLPVNGLGMGFTIMRISMFKNEKLRRPWFKTPASREEGVFTQDLYFAHNAFEHGYKFAVDCSVKVGHVDSEGVIW